MNCDKCGHFMQWHTGEGCCIQDDKKKYCECEYTSWQHHNAQRRERRRNKPAYGIKYTNPQGVK